MREHGSVRRRHEDAPPAEQVPGREPPAAAAMLALQRTAGNRAVQRLVWNSITGNLTVPADYGEQRIPWDGTYMVDREPTQADKPFSERVKEPVFKGHVKTGLGLDFFNAVKAVPATDMERAAPSFVDTTMKKSDVAGDQAVYAKMVHDVAAAAASHNHVLSVAPPERFEDVAAIDAARRIVLRPTDFLPEKPDLQGVGADLFEKVTEDGKETYWHYACVLIALFRCGGIAMVNQITGKQIKNDEVKAVHALHDYYVGKGVQYDDGSQRANVMGEWGYKMIFAGRAEWHDLAQHVALPQGQYIFDIVGHTVKVTVLKDLWSGTAIGSLKEYFEPDSNSKNYPRGEEFTHPVTSIWKA
jgi:hypothetical protein